MTENGIKEDWIMFDNEYCKVTYEPDANAVVLAWKKFSSFENYRNPSRYALEQLRVHKGSSFIVDARNGFEDEKEDVEWVLTEFLPYMVKTDCKNVIFVMNEVNHIENEMDMWTLEFGKYVTVKKVQTLEEAFRILY